MPADDSSADLHKRLDDLEEKVRQFESRGQLPPERQREGEELRAQARELREKVTGAHGTSWENMKHELHEEWEALMQSVERWGQRIDRHFHR